MLDSETKRRIDSCRDILVGKVPDPKSQVEQITIALIYKFMDDMDAESEELNGKRTFFAKEFARFGWAQLMAPGMGGQDVLNLYSEAIGKMNENPGVPTLFRDIFKNAYLPYRDPETLRAFLKEINAFSYDHSERLGDAFEYLLSVLGAQGDAGQFRTPRHLIDFLVEVMNPQKHETVLDPACGTAGFLISAYKHILAHNQKQRPGDTLTPDERKQLVKNFQGYDISPDMVRLSLANLYLHGFPNPSVEEYDTLTSEAHWNDTFDVVLANPPFMSPKGGIRPHKRFSVPSNRSEVLFVDYIAEHLTPQGRAAIIVPEGIIFQSGTAYRALRKELLKHSLVAVVSLPAGVFQPYSGVKTSVLILDKRLAQHAHEVLFVKIANDGFGLGAQRRETTGSELPAAMTQLRTWFHHLRKSAIGTAASDLDGLHLVEKTRIGENGDWNLSGERYRDGVAVATSDYPHVALAELLDLQNGYAFKSDLFNESSGFPIIRIRNIKTNRTNTRYNGDYPPEYVVNDGDFLIGMDGEFNLTLWKGGPALLNQRVCRLRNFRGCLKEYLFRILPPLLKEIEDTTYAVTVKHISSKQILAIEIPLPPLAVQQEIVAEIAGYQQVLDGARQVMAAYQPRIAVDAAWPVVELGEVCDINPKKSALNDIADETPVSFVPMADLGENTMHFVPQEIKVLEEVKKMYTYFQDGDALLAKVTPCFENGKAGIARQLENGIGFGSSEFFVLRPDTKQVLPEWIYFAVITERFREAGKLQMTGTGGLQRIPRGFVESWQIPLPDLATQRHLVAEIEAEQRLVAANQELIERMEARIRAAIGRVWGAAVPAEAVVEAVEV